MQLAQLQTSDEKRCAEILERAAKFKFMAEHYSSCDICWADYEEFKAELKELDLTPEQFALACGMLAKVLGL